LGDGLLRWLPQTIEDVGYGTGPLGIGDVACQVSIVAVVVVLARRAGMLSLKWADPRSFHCHVDDTSPPGCCSWPARTL
jgi:hypothetical protein